MEQRLINLLHDSGASLIVENASGVHSFFGRGVSDLHRLYHSPQKPLKGSLVADKVVGKGAAALMTAGGVAEVYADVVSAPALEFLRKYSVPCSYAKAVDNIINRQGTGICPVETMCIDADTAEECIPLINQFINNISCKQNP